MTALAHQQPLSCQQAPPAHALRQDKAVLEYLKLMHASWARNQDMFGDTHNVAIARLVIIGWMEHRPHDISSLAAGVYISRQQTTRRCLKLARAGWLTIERDANHCIIRPTAKLADMTHSMAPNKMIVMLSKWRKIAAMVGTVAMLGAAAAGDLNPDPNVVELAGDVVPIVKGEVVQHTDVVRPHIA